MTARDAIIAKRIANPCATLEQISSSVGVTKERVRQILKHEGLPTIHWRQTYNCNYCGKVLPSDNKYFCDRDCQRGYGFVTLRCENCGCEVIRRTYQERCNLKNHPNKKVLCHNCRGKYLGRNFGFGAFPEHANLNGRPHFSKYEPLYPIISHLLTDGLSLYKISKLLHISDSCLYPKRDKFQ